MGDWALTSCERQEFSTGLASRGAASAKGAYIELTAATGFQYSAVTLQACAAGGGGQCYLIDIATGAAGSEQVIVPDVLLDCMRGFSQSALNLLLPVLVPTGSRIAARVQEVGGAGTRDVLVALSGRAGGSNYPAARAGSVVNYGANVATTNGVLVDPGAVANTYGAWVEIAASTASAHGGLTAVLGTNKQTGTLVDSHYYFQIALGASGSEIVICEFLSVLSTGATRLHVNSMDIAASIPAGTRVAMRSKCVSSATAAARHPTAIILGY